MPEVRALTEKQKRKIGTAVIIVFLLFCAGVAYFIGRPMIRFVSEPEKFRAWVDSHGLFGKAAFIGMMAFQVIIALVPGEPLEMGAGYAFGAVEGTVLCLLGALLGSAVVFLTVRRFGFRLLEVFFSRDKIHELKFLQNEKKRDTLIFVLFFLPGTPKDLLTYFAGLTEIPLLRFLAITLVARIPSIVTSTMSGSALGLREYARAAIVTAVTLAISAAGLLCYRAICRHRAEK